MSSRQVYDDEVARARGTARALRLIAKITVVFGWCAVALALLALAFDALPWDQAENLLWVLGLGSVVSGVVMYGSSWSLQIGASRMEIDLQTKLPRTDSAPGS